MHLVEEYDLALNVSRFDSETANNNSQDDTLVLQNLCWFYPNVIVYKSRKYKTSSTI